MSASLFDQLKLFDDLKPSQRSIVDPLFARIDELAGSIIFTQGEPAEYLYILACGEVCVQYKPDDGPMITLARIKPEGVFGWSAALGNPEYTSSATCSTDCQMLRIRGDQLRNLCECHPELGSMVAERLAADIAEHLRNTHPRVIALLEEGLRLSGHKFFKIPEASNFD